MFILVSDISIGDFVQVKSHEVRIEKSVHSFLEVAYIKIPLRSRVVGEYTINGQILETSKIFKEGMRVSINLGYTGQMLNEFEGFIARLNFKSPMEIVCEGYSYQLRKRTYLKIFKNSTLREILKYLVIGTDIVLDKDIDDVPITKFDMQGLSGIEVLRKLKTTALHNAVSFRFIKNVLIAEVFPIKQERGVVEYLMGWNVIDANDLAKHEAENDDVEIHFIGIRSDGTKVLSKAGKLKKPIIKTGSAGIESGELKVFTSHEIHDKVALGKMANAKHSQITFDGYKGKITTFLQPYCEPGYKAIIEDKTYPERGGNYIIEAVEVTYGMSGARRKVSIGMQLDKK